MIAGIVVPLLLVLIAVILVFLFLKKKKKANNQGGRNSTYTIYLYCKYHDSFVVFCFSRARAIVSSLRIIAGVVYLCYEYKKPGRDLRVCNSCLWLLELSIDFFLVLDKSSRNSYFASYTL